MALSTCPEHRCCEERGSSSPAVVSSDSNNEEGEQQTGQRPRRADSEVLIMMHKVGPVLPVDKLAGLLHILGHPWRTTAEDSNLMYLSMERHVY